MPPHGIQRKASGRPGQDLEQPGAGDLRAAIERGDTLEAIEARWQPGLSAFEALRRQHLLYP